MKKDMNHINQTMELSEVMDKWTYDEKNKCYCLEDVLYTPYPKATWFQMLSIFVPEEYMNADGSLKEGRKGKYTTHTAPVIFENNASGYMQMPNVRLGEGRCYAEQYLAEGMVCVTVGNRGRKTADAEGKWVGKGVAQLIDLKTAIRFLRHNSKLLAGDWSKIISVGWSAGGAMSTLLSVTGDNANYEEYLKENGAFMEESDAVYAAQIYCPIIDLENANMAYEWLFENSHMAEPSPAGPGGPLNEFQIALSKKLSAKYVEYFNNMKLQHPVTGEELYIGEDRRSGNAYDLLMEELEKAATKYLKRLDAKLELVRATSGDYISGNYTYMDMPPIDPAIFAPVEKDPHAVIHFPPLVEKQGVDKSAWLSFDGEKAHITSLEDYVANHRPRMKTCTSFDQLTNSSGENEIFGTETVNYKHFDENMAEAIASLREEFPEEVARYYDEFASCIGDIEQEKQKYLINPMNFIGTKEVSKQAKAFRIHVGASDADTSFMISLTLAVKLQMLGDKSVEYELIWDKPHCEADYPGEVIAWIDQVWLK